MKALIKVGYACNENCTFCHTREVRHVDGSAAEIHARIDRAARLGHTMVVFSGGEATIRPEIFEWAAHVASLGLDLGLVTNGQMLGYPEFLERLLALRLRYVYMSLHGPSARVHKRLTRADGFERALAAIRNLSGRGLEVTVNTVVARQNLEDLRGIVELLLPYPDLTLKFSMVQPKGGAEELFDFVTPRVSDVAAKVGDAIRDGLERTHGRGPRFAHDGIPLCLLPGLEDLYDDLKTNRFASMVEVGEPDFFPVDDKAKCQPEPCRGCSLRGPCPGLYRGYFEHFGAGELRPRVEGPRSNSFTWTFERLIPAEADTSGGAGCFLLADGITPWDRGRHLFVRNGARVGLFRTDSRDFSDAEIESIKHDLGQVYLDRSRKAAPDDFAADLVQLRRSAQCDTCPEQAACTGLFEPIYEDVFGRDDRRVRELVGALEGDVLDVGCGEGPYGELLAPAALAGRLRYLGIDPDAARIARLKERWPWAELRATTAEQLATELERPFDHLLVLRSWNHLSEPERLLAAAARLLRPEGILTIVDNVAFGLARTPAQAARARSGPAGFEHFRNDTAAEAEARVAPLGFRLLEKSEVSPGTSNQWILRFRAPGPRDATR